MSWKRRVVIKEEINRILLESNMLQKENNILLKETNSLLQLLLRMQ